PTAQRTTAKGQKSLLLLDVRRRLGLVAIPSGARSRGAVAGDRDVALGEIAPAGVGLALLDDAEEIVLQRRCRVAEHVDLAAVTADDLLEIAAQRIIELHAAGVQLEAVDVLQQGADLAQRLQLALVEDGDAVADI